MKKLYYCLIPIFHLLSCKEDSNPKDNYYWFQSKISSIHSSKFDKKEEVSVQLFYSKRDASVVNLLFKWKNPVIELSSFKLNLCLKNKYYECVFDRTDFKDLTISDTIITRKIDLKSCFYKESGSLVLISSNQFFKKIKAVKNIFMHGVINDFHHMSNPEFSSFIRTSNIIEIHIENE